MPNSRIIIPFLNHEVEVFDEPTFYFDDNTFIEKIYVEDFGAFFSGVSNEYKDSINTNTKCIYIDNPVYDDFRDFVQTIAIKIRYALNCFAIDHPPIFPYAYLLNKGDNKQSSEILELADIEAVANAHKFKNQRFKVKEERENLSNFFKLIDSVCKNKQVALFTIDRFNSCLTRAKELDQIVDACISLESLINGNSELVFRFSLYHSLIAESDISKRIDTFNLFKSFYSARSTIVHGGIEDKSVIKVKENWETIKDLAKRSINYYLAYLYEKPDGNWDEHLKNLALGVEDRVL